MSILFTVGCDSGGSKSNSLFQRLVGTWRLDRVQANGSKFDFGDDDPVRVEFSQREDIRLYRIIRSASNDTTLSGRVDVLENNILRMTVGAGLLEWSFDFGEPEDVSGSVRFRFQGETNESVQDFLEAIGVGGDAQRLQFDLERSSG